MRTFAIAVLLLSAAAPSQARTDFDLEMKAHAQALKTSAAQDKALLASGMQENLNAVWKKMLIAIGADSTVGSNYPDLGLNCDVMIDFGDLSGRPSCGDRQDRERMERDESLHRGLAHRAREKVREMFHRVEGGKADAAELASIGQRLEAIRTAVAAVSGFSERLSAELDYKGRSHRYAYDKKEHKDMVAKAWALPNEMAEITATRLSRIKSKQHASSPQLLPTPETQTVELCSLPGGPGCGGD